MHSANLEQKYSAEIIALTNSRSLNINDSKDWEFHKLASLQDRKHICEMSLTDPSKKSAFKFVCM